jgi:hypothetical protein
VRGGDALDSSSFALSNEGEQRIENVIDIVEHISIMDTENAMAYGGNPPCTATRHEPPQAWSSGCHHPPPPHFPLPTRKSAKYGPTGACLTNLKPPSRRSRNLDQSFASAEIGCDRRVRDLFVRHG